MAKRICKKWYRDADGKETRTPTGATVATVLKFENGSDTVVVLADLSAEIKTIATAHGIAQKVGDSFAEADGNIDVAHGLADSMADRLNGGDWNLRGEGGASVTLLAQALAEVTTEPLADAITKVGDMSKEEKADLRKHPQMAAVLSRMEAERAQVKLDKATLAAEACDIPLPI